MAKVLITPVRSSTMVDFAVSTDNGITWTFQESDLEMGGILDSSTAKSLAYGKPSGMTRPCYVLAGSSYVAWSYDGIVWTRNAWTSISGRPRVVFNGTYFVLIDSPTNDGANAYSAIYRTNNLTIGTWPWTSLTQNFYSLGGQQLSIDANPSTGTICVSGCVGLSGDHAIMVSTDHGSNWTSKGVVTGSFSNGTIVYYGSNKWAAIGTGTPCTLRTSADDGATWSSHNCTMSTTIGGAGSLAVSSTGRWMYLDYNTTSLNYNTGADVTATTNSTTVALKGTGGYAGRKVYHNGSYFVINPVTGEEGQYSSTASTNASWTLTSAANVAHDTTPVYGPYAVFSSAVSSTLSSWSRVLSRYQIASALTTSVSLVNLGIIRGVTAIASSISAAFKSSNANKIIRATSVSIKQSTAKKFWSTLWSFVYDGLQWVGVKNRSNSAATSTDGESWTLQTLPSTKNWSAISNNGTNSVTVASNSNQAAYTADGILWNSSTLPSTGIWNSIATDGTNFVAVKIGSDTCALSTDGGVTWTEQTMPSFNNWTSVAHNGTAYCAVGYGVSATSTDGISWTQHSMPDTIDYSCIAWAAGQFTAVATGPTNLAAKSTNGATWSRIYMPSSQNWTAVGPGIGNPDV